MTATERMRKWRKQNPEKCKAQVKKQNKKKKQWYNDLKNDFCEDCKKKYPQWIMEFDHVPERGLVSFRIGDYSQHSWEKLLEELFKCDLVCANCHLQRTYDRRRRKE